jgi:hypothetical protein
MLHIINDTSYLDTHTYVTVRGSEVGTVMF